MSSGGSSGMPATPAPTPFSHGPGGVRPEDLAAGISRLSVIQEAADSGNIFSGGAYRIADLLPHSVLSSITF